MANPVSKIVVQLILTDGPSETLAGMNETGRHFPSDCRYGHVNQAADEVSSVVVKDLPYAMLAQTERQDMQPADKHAAASTTDMGPALQLITLSLQRIDLLGK